MVGFHDWDFDIPLDDEVPGSPQGNLQRLLRILRRVARQFDVGWPEGDLDSPPEFTDELTRALGDAARALLGLDRELRQVIRSLNRALDARPDLKDQAERDTPPGLAPMTFVPTQVFAGRKPIHLGSIDRYFVFPALLPPSFTIAYLISKIVGTDDLLVREQHDVFGWHYHYCDCHKRRSDTLMSFDRSRLAAHASWHDRLLVPLCWELHGVNKAQFRAKPWNWRDKKRESIYAACLPDLAIQPPLTYKLPSKEAKDVWPV